MLIPFEDEYRKEFFEIQNKIFESNFWSEGECTKKFENEFGKYVGCASKAIASGGAALYSILEYIGIKGDDVIVPANTFWADIRAVQLAGGNVIYADCNKEDLCLSLDNLKKKITIKTKAVIIVHIGGHIAFQIKEIAQFCLEKGIYLIEDCAHAHGATYQGKAAGTFGFAGAYSFYATKTMPLGEGGMVVSKCDILLQWIELFRNYGKRVEKGRVNYEITNGFNFRINEFTAALGVVQLKRLDKILKWKRKLALKYDQIFENRVKFPQDMISGYYKYIVFDYKLKEEAGKVFLESDFGTAIEKRTDEMIPNSIWVAHGHKCVPIYYGYINADKSIEELKEILIGLNYG